MDPETKEAAKDVAATGVGGMSGIDMIYTGIDGMLKDGIDAPEIKLIAYGLFALIAGFFAFRRSQKPAPAVANP